MIKGKIYNSVTEEFWDHITLAGLLFISIMGTIIGLCCIGIQAKKDASDNNESGDDESVEQPYRTPLYDDDWIQYISILQIV